MCGEVGEDAVERAGDGDSRGTVVPRMLALAGFDGRDHRLHNNGFWSREFSTADDAAFAAPFSVPFMSGFGGITVALMPNGSSYYVFSDNNEFSWVDVVAESNRISPMPGG